LGERANGETLAALGQLNAGDEGGCYGAKAHGEDTEFSVGGSNLLRSRHMYVVIFCEVALRQKARAV
jgi:hypothetical protein